MKTDKIVNLPLDKFINISLYNKKSGYYIKKNPFGKKGDFITAPNAVSYTHLTLPTIYSV